MSSIAERARFPEDALARALTTTRRDRRWAQADLAAFLRSGGLPWDRNTVRHVEDRTRDVSVSEFFKLVELLRIRFEGPLKLDDSWSSADAGTDYLVRILRHEDSASELGLRAEMFGDEQADRALEQKAVERLGLKLASIRRLTRRRWGHGLAQERERRVRHRLGDRDLSARSLQAVRGHVTRELLEELDRLLPGRAAR